MPSRPLTLAFDLYGTLLSTESIATKLEAHFDSEKAKAITSLWRRYQLEYTWRLNSMGLYLDFAMVTRRALSEALSEHSSALSDTELVNLSNNWQSLTEYPDVAPALSALSSLRASNPALKIVLFTNASEALLSTHHSTSPILSSAFSAPADLISVEESRKYKPAPETYLHLASKLGVGELDEKGLWDLVLVSSNAFDVVGAAAVGMRAIWIDRAGSGWKDALMPGTRERPTEVVRDLGGVVGVVERWLGEER